MSERRAIAALRVHPRNAAIYGDVADESLVDSVALFGVLDPLLVTPDGVVLSGHRRLDAARRAGLDEVEVIVRPVADELEALSIILGTNKNRAKTTEQQAREARQALFLETGPAKKRQKAGPGHPHQQSRGE